MKQIKIDLKNGGEVRMIAKELLTGRVVVLPTDTIYGLSTIVTDKAEEVFGEGISKVGDSEKFWNYEVEDGSYLSLRIDNKTGERMDLTGKIIKLVNATVIN